MILNALWAQILVAILGGIAAEFLHWYMLSRKPVGTAPYRTDLVYWAFTAGMVLLGGVMPVLYNEGSASALLCFHLGATTPIVLQQLIKAAPKAAARQNALTQVSWRTFYDW